MQTPNPPPNPPDGMSEAEWRTRCDLAAVYRIAHFLGWTDLINTHMSARIPDQPDRFLINYHGQLFDEITASSLVKMDMEGRVIGPEGHYNSAGFTIHSACYIARPDAMCVLHTHTRAGNAVSMIANGLRPLNQDTIHVLDDVAYHPYGIPSSRQEGEALKRAVARNNCIVLMNHGLLTVTHSIHNGVYLHYRLERACQQEMSARMMNAPAVMIEDEVVAAAAVYMRKLRDSPDYGRDEFAALVRAVDRIDPGYRH